MSGGNGGASAATPILEMIDPGRKSGEAAPQKTKMLKC
jgi:hypothetical protein